MTETSPYMAHRNAEAELKAIARPVELSLESKLQQLRSSSVSAVGTELWITVNGREVTDEGVVVDRSNDRYDPRGVWHGAAGLVEARAVVAGIHERATLLGVEVDVKIHYRIFYTVASKAGEIQAIAPKDAK